MRKPRKARRRKAAELPGCARDEAAGIQRCIQFRVDNSASAGSVTGVLAELLVELMDKTQTTDRGGTKTN